MKKIATLAALSSFALLAAAGPVAVSGNTRALPSSFSASHSIHLATGGLFDFALRTASYGVDDLLLTSVHFSKGAQSLVFDAAPDGSQLRAEGLTTDLAQIDLDDPDFLVDRFTREYRLTPTSLEAGTWTIRFNGTDTDNKVFSEYRLNLNASQVPEPAAFALLVAALVPAVALSKKPKAS